MSPRRASFTAEVIAAARAIESTRPQAVRLFDDPYGKCFVLHPLTRAAVGIARLFAAPDLADRIFDRIAGVSGLMMSFCCRTRCIDDVLRSGLNAGCKQVLILGAGYDCRAYRIPNIDRAKVFDVDHAATQDFKRSRLRTTVDPNQAHIVYAPVDFERDDLRARLIAAGFRSDAQSFVIWEGVSQYLRPESVDSVLKTVAAICAPESSMAFTYIHGGVLDDSGQFPEADRLVRRAGNAGEPWLFGLRPKDVAGFLRARGLTLLKNFDPGALVATYLSPTGRSGALPAFTHVAVARVSGPADEALGSGIQR